MINKSSEKSDGKNVDVTVNVDVSKIVRNVAVAGVLIVGIIFGCNTYRKLCAWEEDQYFSPSGVYARQRANWANLATQHKKEI